MVTFILYCVAMNPVRGDFINSETLNSESIDYCQI